MSTGEVPIPPASEGKEYPIRTLKACLPSHNPRYNYPLSGPTNSGLNVIPAGQNFPDNDNIVQNGWFEFITPEGDRYFRHSGHGILTPLNLRQSGTEQQIFFAHDHLIQAIGGLQNLPRCEVYLNMSTPGDMQYYFVDHDVKQVFWVENLDVGQLGMYPFSSPGFLKSALVPEYWTHVDYFSMHRPIAEEDEDELLGILRHGCIDGMTSPGSTSPYSADECRQYIGVLEGFQNRGVQSGYRTASFARIWSAIARTRHINGYGLDSPRLDRLQGLFEYLQSQTQTSLKLSLGECLCFNLSRRTFDRLTALWNGRVVYQRHWDVFFRDMRSDWLRMGALGGLVSLGATTILASGESSLPIVASASCGGAAVFVSAYLYQTHSASQLTTGPEISGYVMKMEDGRHGLRPLSIAFTTPHALTIYSALFLIAGMFMRGLEQVNDIQTVSLLTAAWCLPFLLAFMFLSRF